MAKTKKAAAAAVALTLSAAMGLAQNPRFAIRERDCFEPAAPSGDVLLFDGDGDGVKDILVGTGTQQTGYQLVFYRNDGTGRFVRGASSPGSLSVAMNGVAVGDVDGDGDDDIFTTGLLRNLGNGVLAWSPSTPSLGTWIIQPESQFFDADADDDLDLWVQHAGVAHLWRNDGTGTFTVPISGLFPAPASDSLLIDAERDGDVDMILTGSGVRVLARNDGLGNFTIDTNAILPQPTSWFQLAGVAMDVDGDGFDDLAIPGLPDILRNDGTGNFTPFTSTNLVDPPWGTWFDWNMDGRDDRWFGNRVDLSTGSLAFSPVSLPRRQFTYRQVLYADLDGDLDPDVVAPGNPVQVTFNGAAGPCNGTTTATNLFDQNNQPEDITPFDTQNGVNVLMAVNYSGQFGLPALYRFFSQTYVTRLDAYQVALGLPAGSFTDAAWLQSDVYQKTIVVCDPNGAGVTMRDDTPQSIVSLPGSPTSTRVDCGDLDGDFLPEIVLGDPNGNGPEVVRYQTWTYVSNGRIPVPPPPNHPAPAIDALFLADMDGDGDLDIVHELRVLTNDGSGAFVVAADFSALVGNYATDLLPIDFDRDGDKDLLVYGGSPTQLLRNDGTTFADATVGRLPPYELAATKVASAADVDRDGDTDLLLCRSGNANLLRNDGGTFVRFPAVAPTGVLVDRDLDGFPDVFTGLRTYHNLHDHLWIPRPAALGIDWRIRVEAWREGPAVQYAMLAIGAPYSALVDVPGLGTVKMDLGTAAVGTLPLVGGSGEVSIPIPSSPLLLGLQLGVQAVIADPLGWTLTDLVVDQIQ